MKFLRIIFLFTVMIAFNAESINQILKTYRTDRRRGDNNKKKNYYSPWYRYQSIKHPKKKITLIENKGNKNYLLKDIYKPKSKEILTPLPDYKDVIDMKNWSKDTLQRVLSFDFYEIEKELLDNLQSSLLILADRLEIKKPNQVSSFFLAHYIVNIRAANEARRASRFYYIEGPSKGKYIGPKYNEIWYTAWEDSSPFTIKNDPFFIEYLDKAYIAAEKIVLDEAVKNAEDATREALAITIPKLELTNPHQIYDAAKYLAKIFVLAYITTSDFQKNYFETAYLCALNDLECCKRLPKHINNGIIHSVIGEHTWFKMVYYNEWYSELSRLTKNPYIQSLKNIMTTIVDKSKI